MSSTISLRAQSVSLPLSESHVVGQASQNLKHHITAYLASGGDAAHVFGILYDVLFPNAPRLYPAPQPQLVTTSVENGPNNQPPLPSSTFSHRFERDGERDWARRLIEEVKNESHTVEDESSSEEEEGGDEEEHCSTLIDTRSPSTTVRASPRVAGLNQATPFDGDQSAASATPTTTVSWRVNPPRAKQSPRTRKSLSRSGIAQNIGCGLNPITSRNEKDREPSPTNAPELDTTTPSHHRNSQPSSRTTSRVHSSPDEQGDNKLRQLCEIAAQLIHIRGDTTFASGA